MIQRFLTALTLLGLPAALPAQITSAEYAARRDSLAARIGNGVVVAFGGRTPIADFGPFYQIPSFRYLTGYEYADAALVMVARAGRGTSILYVHRSTPRRSLYYGEEPDSATLLRDFRLSSRDESVLGAAVDSLARLGLPVFVPSLVLSTDNAAMIAAAGLRNFHAGIRAGWDLNADASLEMFP